MEPRMTSVRRIRTFADDVRRAKKGGTTPPLQNEPPKKITTPVTATVIRVEPHADIPKPPVKIPAPESAERSKQAFSLAQNQGVFARQGRHSAPPSSMSRMTVWETPILPAEKTAGRSGLLVKQTTVDTDAQSADVADASIISDKKVTQWSLWGALGASLREWFNTFFSRDDAQKNIARVIPGTQRASIVRAAHIENHNPPQNDHEELVGKLKEVIASREPIRDSAYVVPGAVTAQWSTAAQDERATSPATVEPTQSIKRGRPHIIAEATSSKTHELLIKDVPIPAPIAPLATSTVPAFSQKEDIVPEPKQQEVGATPSHTPRLVRQDVQIPAPIVPPIIQTAPPTLTPEENIVPEPNQQEAEPLMYIPPAQEVSTAPVTQSEKPLPFQQSPSAEVSDDPPQEELSPDSPTVEDALLDLKQATVAVEESFTERARERARERIAYEQQSEKAPSRLILYVGMAIVFVFSVFIIYSIGTQLYTYFMRESTVTPEPVGSDRVPLLFAVSQSDPVSLVGDKRSLLNELERRVREATGTQNGFAHFYLTAQDDPTQTSLPAQAFIEATGIQAPGAFLRTIGRVMMFGAYLDNPHAPFIVFKVKNIEDAYGGMLAWEPFINSDLEPLFGENITFLGYSNRRFTDEEINGRDARIQTTADGDIVVLYSFVDPHTLVITNSREALRALQEALK